MIKIEFYIKIYLQTAKGIFEQGCLNPVQCSHKLALTT